MSDNKFWSGKVIPTGITAEDYAKSKGMEIDEDFWYYGDFPNDVVVINGMIWITDGKNLDPYGDVISTKNEDGSFDITVLYYDGGTCLSEIIEEVINKEEES